MGVVVRPMALRRSRCRSFRALSGVGVVGPTGAEQICFWNVLHNVTRRASRRKERLGLGLSIVQAIAQAHDASITAEPRPGGGLIVRIDFPASP
ncbi:MAG TPA: ATP-binding protein [Gaiellaceae bacterium]|nr:ATP-binding protein [Gaiellaceae bacterium]